MWGRLNLNCCDDNWDFNRGRLHLAMREDCHGTFVTGLVRVVMNQLMQRRASRHRVEKQNYSDQQYRERRLAVPCELECSCLQIAFKLANAVLRASFICAVR